MVHKKRTYYERFDGLCTPVVPKAPRSIRRSPHRKSPDCGEISAFELLAAVAGKLLQESESSTSSTGPEGKEQIRIPNEVKVKPVRFEYRDQGSCIENDFIHEPITPKRKLERALKNLPESDNQTLEVEYNVKLEASEGKNGVNDTPRKPEGNLSRYGDLCDINSGIDRSEPRSEAVEKQIGDLTAVKTCTLSPHVLNKSCSSVHLPFYSDPVPSACFHRQRDDVKIGIRDDDDENSFRSNYLSSKIKAFRSQSSAGCRRIRKMLTSRYWKVAPKLKDYEHSNGASDGDKPVHLSKKRIYMRERCQGDPAYKRRKLFRQSLKTALVQETSNENIFNLHEKSSGGNKKHPSASFNKVKLSIKSIKVPEMHVEVPETATVASLKRTVMEAVTASLEGELRVGLLLQGKKVRDDYRTLQQTGISQNSNLETLQFTLEPSFPQTSSSLVQKEPPLLLPCDIHQHLTGTVAIDVGFLNSSVDPPAATNLGCHIEQQESKPVLTKERMENFKTLVPLNNKPTKRSELSQRRTRRPFSVSEVEALVEAVETLGTGRWRDVKMRSFDDANHRTYVDLKDKWKTLVHTASISRQQRRGEAVPQDLLDRVLAAHAYWSHHHIQPLQNLPTPIKVF